jgi:ribose-phosphate pyrophosphokinase
MIKIKTENGEFVIKPTIFSDKTSQCWHLSEKLLNSKKYEFTWMFEDEREIVDLYSLKQLLSWKSESTLFLPYMPYARQDKLPSNEVTFNLHVFGRLINNLGFDKVTSVDVHNEEMCNKIFYNFKNIPVTDIHKELIARLSPDFVVFPDKGAKDRYKASAGDTPVVYYEKIRDQATGNITGLKSVPPKGTSYLQASSSLLILDDLADGGATFVKIARNLREMQSNLVIKLFVTHGLFTKGREYLTNSGIDEIITTNSLLRNSEGIKVC